MTDNRAIGHILPDFSRYDLLYFFAVPVFGGLLFGGFSGPTIDLLLSLQLFAYWLCYLAIIWWSIYLFTVITYKLMFSLKPPLWFVCAMGAIVGGFVMLYPIAFFSEKGYQWFDPELMPPGPMWPQWSMIFFSYYLKFTLIGIVVWVSFNYLFASFQNNFRFSYPADTKQQSSDEANDNFKQFQQYLNDIDIKDIAYLEAQENYIYLHTLEKKLLIRFSVSKAINALEHANIEGIRIHRSYWVAKEAIKSLEKNNNRHSINLINGKVLPISRTYLAKVRQFVSD